MSNFLKRFKWYRRRKGGLWLLVLAFPPCGSSFEFWQNSCDLAHFERVKEIEIYSTVQLRGRQKFMSNEAASAVLRNIEKKAV
jgi:cbb3-type cytochrome oxidase cytochrome c subunit